MYLPSHSIRIAQLNATEQRVFAEEGRGAAIHAGVKLGSRGMERRRKLHPQMEEVAFIVETGLLVWRKSISSQ